MIVARISLGPEVTTPRELREGTRRMAHASGGFWPLVNKGEAAVLYCFAFLYMAARGSGRFSIDGMRRGAPAPRR